MDQIMYLAAMEGKIDVLMQKVDQFGVQVTPNKNTVLHIASLFGKTECVDMILRNFPSLLLRVNDNHETPLHIAVKEEQMETVKVLIEHARVRAIVTDEIESGSVNAAQEMVRMTNEDGDTALHDAVRNGNVRLVRMLIEEDPEFSHPPNKAGETPLYLAAENNLEDCVSMMLSICSSPSPIGPCGRTALHAAAIYPYDGIMTKLLSWKPDLVKEVDEKGWTPLHHAANFGLSDRVTQLLDFNASLAYITTANDDMNTALHIAASQSQVEVMTNLFSKCPDCLEMLNSKGQNIVHIALENQKDEVIKFILNLPYNLQGRLVRQKDLNGNTPLHLLADNSVSECVVPELITHPRAYHMDFNKENMTPYDVYIRQSTELVSGVVGRTFQKFGLLGQRHVTNRPEPTRRNFHSIKRGQGKSSVEELKKLADTNLIVATLIATMTFAAGFTLPGGYNGSDGPNEGMAVLTRKVAFKVFIIVDTIAMMSSSTAIFVYFNIAGLKNKQKLLPHQAFANILVMIAEVMMMLSFITGTYVVLEPSLGLAIFVCVLGFFFFLIQYRENKSINRYYLTNGTGDI